jgi:hypothetical protein
VDQPTALLAGLLGLNERLTARSWRLPTYGFWHRIEHVADTKTFILDIYTLSMVWIPVLSNLFPSLRWGAVFYFGVSR